MSIAADCREVLVTELKFLAFRPARPDVKRLRWHFLALGLVSSWLAGMGRYWDTPDAQWWQYAGLGSVVYTFFMATFLFALILLGLDGTNESSFREVLDFVEQSGLYEVQVTLQTPFPGTPL
jgi:hypothetical protein